MSCHVPEVGTVGKWEEQMADGMALAVGGLRVVHQVGPQGIHREQGEWMILVAARPQGIHHDLGEWKLGEQRWDAGGVGRLFV